MWVPGKKSSDVSRGSGRVVEVPDDGVPARIGAIVARRHELVAPVRAEIAWWQRVDGQLVGLVAAVAALRDHPATPDELAGMLGEVGLDARVEELRTGIAEATRLLRVLSAR